MTEISAGCISEPTDITETIAKTTPSTPRFSPRGQRGNQERKIRLIDDFKALAINAIIETDEPDEPGNLEVFVALASYLKLLAPGFEVKCATLDFAHAYKHVPTQEGQKEFAAILLDPPDGALKVATLRTKPFASGRAPTNWPRVTLFIKWAMAALFSLVIAVYDGDIIIVETSQTIDSAIGALKLVCETLCFQLEAAKERPPPSEIFLLGAEVEIDTNGISAKLPGGKKGYSKRTAASFGQEYVSASARIENQGRLGYAQSLLFGIVGRALLAPFEKRQFSSFSIRFRPLNDELGKFRHGG